MKPPATPPHATALLLTLWAILVLAVCLITLVAVVDADVGMESVAARRFVARQQALSGLAIGSHPQIEAGDPLLVQKSSPIERFEVAITGENGRLNINEAAADSKSTLLRDLFTLWGASRGDAEKAADSLKDWMDPDDFRSLNGAERADIPPPSGYSPPENRKFRSVSEMEQVRGMDRVAEVNPSWEDAFTVFSTFPLSLADAAADLLQVYGGLDPAQAVSLVRLRAGKDGLSGTEDDVKLDSAEQAARLIGLNPTQTTLLGTHFGGRGQIKRITSHGWCGGVRYEIVVVRGAEEGSLKWSEN